MAMPNVDESQQERETFGAAPGWGNSQSTREPMGVPGASETSPVSDAESAPSAEQQVEEASESQAPQQAPAPTSQPDAQKQWNMPPAERWDELRRERDEARRLAQLALEKMQAPQAAAAPVASDPWTGLVDHADPATAQFYQRQKQLVEATAEKIASAKLAHTQQILQQGEQELLALKVNQFRAQYGIKPNSSEEQAMVPFINRGFDLETSYKLAKFNQLEAELNTLKGKQASIPRKVAAGNSEASSGIPSASGLPSKQADWRQRAGDIADKGGSFKDIVKAAFG